MKVVICCDSGRLPDGLHLILLTWQALGESLEAGQMLHRAQGVCFEVKLQEAGLAPAVSKKLHLLLSVLNAQAASASAEAT